MADPTYQQPNIVSLGGTDWIIAGPITRSPAEEFAVGLRMTEPRYDTRQGAQFRNFNDFRGGLGVRIGDARDYPDRFWASRDVRTWESAGDLTLAPLLTEATLGAIVPSASAGLDPGGAWQVAPEGASQAYTLFGAMGHKVFKTVNTAEPVTFTAITPGGGPASAQTFALSLHQNPTNILDKSLYWATGSAADIWKYNVLSQTWSQPAAGVKSQGFITFDSKLYSIYQGQISVSADGGATWTDIIRVPHSNNITGFFVGAGLDSFGQLMPYVVAEGKLFAVDVWTRQAIEVDIGLPSTITAAITWQDGEVVVTDGYYVKAYHPTRPVRNMGFDRDNGLQFLGFIRNFTVVAGKYLVAQVDIGTNLFNLYMWDGKGWHVVTGSDAIFGPFGLWPNPAHPSLAFYNGASVFNPAQTLWAMAWQSNRARIYHMACDAFKNPQLVSAHQYAGSVAGNIITPWFDGGFAEMDGTAIEVEVNGVFNGAAKQLVVKYRLDNSEGAYTTLGTTSGTATVQRFRFASGQGVTFKNIQFEFDLVRDTTVTNTPVVRAIIFKYIKRPRLRSTISFTVDITATARANGTTEGNTIDALYAMADDNPLLALGLLGEATTYVQVKQMQRLENMRQDAVNKTGTIQVVVEEPV